jgi:hypothetical protein
VSEIRAVRLLQNPLGQEAPTGERGDFVRITDGAISAYLTVPEFEAADRATLQWLLAREAARRHG